MTGREKIRAAFTADGTPEIGVVSAYEDIIIRDHFAAITRLPWWEAYGTVGLARDFVAATGIEWLTVRPGPSRAERARQRQEQRADGVWVIDGGTGREWRLEEPKPSGTNTNCARSTHTDLDSLPATRSAIDALIPPAPEFDRATFLAEGRQDSAVAIRESLDLFLYGQVGTPIWSLYGLFGYEGLMVLLGQRPDLAEYAARRTLEELKQSIRMIAALGADAVWLEECLTDQISPELFRKINVPILQECVAAIRAAGMRSIYYFCGNPQDRLDAILEVGADALHFEEGKKGFTIDIADIVDRVRGRCLVFGNLDVLGLLPRATEDQLRSEIRRQLAAGRRNRNRFVMSTGSPATPGTSVAQVRRYTELVRELGRG